MSIAKAHQTVDFLIIFLQLTKRETKKIKVTLCSSVFMQKALLLMQDVETGWNSTYLMLKRLEKFKTSVQNYVATNKFKPKNILTSDEWKLVSLLNILLKLFYIEMQQCS